VQARLVNQRKGQVKRESMTKASRNTTKATAKKKAAAVAIDW
jgi:hypothetical protein